jgi:predicted N-formylglutamate amidohydrolase
MSSRGGIVLDNIVYHTRENGFEKVVTECRNNEFIKPQYQQMMRSWARYLHILYQQVQ